MNSTLRCGTRCCRAVATSRPDMRGMITSVSSRSMRPPRASAIAIASSAVVGHEHLVAVRPQDVGGQATHGRVILDHQHRLVSTSARARSAAARRSSAAADASASGRYTVNVDPSPGAVLDDDVAAALLDDAVRRRAGPGRDPRPLALVVKNGSKMRPRVSSSMPTPVSDTDTVT